MPVHKTKSGGWKCCTKCKVKKEYKDFQKHDSTKNGLTSWCTECMNKNSALYRKNNRTRVRETHGNYRRNLQDRAVNYLGSKCAICGINDERVLEIDHIVPVKGCRETSRYYLLRAILNGSKNYQLLCANCHKIKTAHDFNYKRHAY